MKKKSIWRNGMIMILMSCTFLSQNLDPSCPALQKISGNAKSIWIGHTKDIASMAFTSGAVTTFTMAASTYLYKYTSKGEKIGCTYNLVAGENVNLFEQSVAIPLYHATQAERNAIEELCRAQDLFIIVEELAGVLSVYGINNTVTGNFDEFGLKTTAGEGGTGILLNDDNGYKVTLSRNVPCMPMQYKPAVALATNIAALDALVLP